MMVGIRMLLVLTAFLQGSFCWKMRDLKEDRRNLQRLFRLTNADSGYSDKERNVGKRYEDVDFPPGVTPIINKPREEIIRESSRFTSAGEPDYSEQVEVGRTGQQEVLVEGDMHLTLEQWQEIQALRNGSLSLDTRKGQANTRYRWRDNVVPYTIQDGVYSDSERAEIVNALEDWSGFTCVEWRPRTTENNYVSIQYGGGCSSYVGMIGNMQPITLGQYCYQYDVALHEMGHALGLWHEQSRHDRDNYVTVHYENMDQNMANNFEKYPEVDLVYFGLQYDYSSIMHYGQSFFSSNGEPTITTVDPAYQTLIGNGNGLSFADVKLVNGMYNCGSHCPGSCPSNGFMDKNCICQCPSHTSPFDFCGHIPYTPCDGSAYQGPAPRPCPECVDNHNVPTCNWYRENGACEMGSQYHTDALTNCYRTCTDCANPTVATAPTTPDANTPSATTPGAATPSPTAGNPSTTVTECVDNYNIIATCNWYKENGACELGSVYYTEAMRNCYKTCSECDIETAGTTPTTTPDTTTYRATTPSRANTPSTTHGTSTTGVTTASPTPGNQTVSTTPSTTHGSSTPTTSIATHSPMPTTTTLSPDNDCTITQTEVYGTASGTAYSLQPRPLSTITGLLVKSGHVLDGLGFVYEDGTQQYAGDEATASHGVDTFMLSGGDQLERVSGEWLVSDNWYGSIVSSITFTTQEGVVLGPYGDYTFAHNGIRSFEMSIGDWCGFGISGAAGNRGITIGFRSESDCMEHDIDYAGSDLHYWGVSSSSAQECSSLCRQLSTCEFWTWAADQSHNNCYRKTSDAGRGYRANTISGSRSCGDDLVEVDPMTQCLDACQQESGCTADNDESNGCNQMYSCSHACKMRALGVDQQTCQQHCRRNGQSGCWPVVNNWQFRLCGACRRGGCRNHWPSIQECVVGCRNYDGDGETAGCGGQLTDSTGVIMSPNYPSVYPNDGHCEWTITVPANKVIRFEQTPGTSFGIEDGPSCRYDSVEIAFGVGSDSYCGNSFPTVQTHTNTARLIFTSDGSIAQGGFSITYSSVDAYSPIPSTTPSPGSGCGGTLVGSSGIITSPNYPNPYHNNANCEWTVEVPTGQVIRFEQTPGTQFNIESCGSCQYDVLEIDSGSTTARDCGSGFSSITTTSNVAQVTFVSDCSVTLGGFSITYTAVDAPPPAPVSNCVDENANCQYWFDNGYCQGAYAAYMTRRCAATCNYC